MAKTTIITGGNTGLGFETAKIIGAEMVGPVVIACRNKKLGEEAVKRLQKLGCYAIYLPLDLADLSSVWDFFDIFRASDLPPLGAIICNAGMQNVGQPQKTAEGIETTFAVNHLGHYLFVRLALQDMDINGRIVFISSGTHDPAEKTRVPSPEYKNAASAAYDFEPGRNAGLRRYSTSKLCNLLCAYELSRRLKESTDPRLSSIIVNTINPGMVSGTGLARTWPKSVQWVAKAVMLIMQITSGNVHSAAKAATHVAALAFEEDGRLYGRYYSNGIEIRSSDQSYDRNLQLELWNSSAGMIGLPMGLTVELHPKLTHFPENLHPKLPHF